VGSAAKAKAALDVTHVVSGTVAEENGRVRLHILLTDTRTGANSGDWQAEYAPGEVRYAAGAIAGVVTASLRLPPLGVADVKPKALEDYRAGLALTRRNSTVEKALPLLERAVAADPDSPLTWAGLAEAQWFEYFMTHDPAWLDRMSDALQQAQIRDLDLAPVHRAAGLFKANAGSYEQAESEYQRAIELEPSNGDAHRRLGMIYLRSNRANLSLAELKKAVELDPNNFKTYQDLGSFYRQQGDLKQAARLFEKCVALAPDEPDAHFVLGTAYQEEDRLAESQRELLAAIGLQASPPALNNLGITLMLMGKDREAIPFLNRASAGMREQYLTLLNLGTAYQRSNQTGASRQAYQQSLKLAEKELARDPRDGLVRSRVAYLYARLGRRADSESEIAQALSLAPDDYNARTMAVQVYETLGKRDQALDILRNSPDSVLLATQRWPELAGLVKDSRFQLLAASHQVK
jgi:serine/threonine-protein kinase